MNDATPDPGYLAWLNSVQRKAVESLVRRDHDSQSLVNQPLTVIQEAEAITKDAAIISEAEANDLRAHFALVYKG